VAAASAEVGGMSLLETRQLAKSFGETHAVDRVDFRVNKGEVLALIGSNGAGKTTLVNLVSGLIPPDSGTIEFQGADITRASVHQKIGAGIARSFQLVNLFDHLSAFDNIALTIFFREGKTRWMTSFADCAAPIRSRRCSPGCRCSTTSISPVAASRAGATRCCARAATMA